ncbi:MAG TPA: hypothetical protein VFQ60_01205 [Patescibacteria group bacterium]|nr:hypothetical protein [Patescibacteria group bacterium]
MTAERPGITSENNDLLDFKKVKEGREREKKIAKLNASILETEKQLDEMEDWFDGLREEVDVDTDNASLMYAIVEAIAEKETELDRVRKKFHSSKQVQTLENEIEHLEQKQKMWEKQYETYINLQDELKTLLEELFDLAGEAAFRVSLGADGYDTQEIDDIVIALRQKKETCRATETSLVNGRSLQEDWDTERDDD